MQNKQSQFTLLWMKIPLVIRAIILGFSISTLGVTIWAIAPAFIPGIWSVVFMAIILILFIRFFSGKWIKNTTQQFRKDNFKSTKLSSYKLKWGVLAALLMAFIVQASLTFIFRLMEYPEAMFKAEYEIIGKLPVASAWIFIIMASLVAGICEEVGYRGYLQTPLEKKYGAKIAIGITSAVFVVIHLHQAWAPSIIPLIFMASALLGYMSYCFKSIIPGIIAHVTFDIFNFSYWWSDLLGKFTLQPISKTGVDQHFVLTCLVLLTSIAAFIFINRMVKNKETLQTAH
ncbi:MAG: CPBP family intramembrane metalloprotease [Flavobacteriaceae bacterium]